MADPAVAPVQNPLTLRMKLKFPSTQWGLSIPAVKKSTDSVRILHFAWFVAVPYTTNEVLLVTVYDGDFDAYLDAFIDSNLEGFNKVLEMLEDAPPPHLERPEVREQFHVWARKNNLARPDFQEGDPLPARLGDFFSAYPTMNVNTILACPQNE